MAEVVGLAFSTMAGRRAMVGRHLRRVVGPEVSAAALEGLVNRAFVSYANFWWDSLRLPHISARELGSHVSAEGFEHLQEGLARGRGVILALPHLGSWDFGGAWLASMGHPMTVVTEPLEPPELFEWFTNLRRAAGLDVVAFGPGATSAVIAALRANRVVGLLADRDLGGRGVRVSFFGEETTLPAGPATLALRTGATLLPAAVLDEAGGRHRAVMRAALDTQRRAKLAEDVARITRALVAELESLIRQAPAQWHLFQPNWPSDHE